MISRISRRLFLIKIFPFFQHVYERLPHVTKSTMRQWQAKTGSRNSRTSEQLQTNVTFLKLIGKALLTSVFDGNPNPPYYRGDKTHLWLIKSYHPNLCSVLQSPSSLQVFVHYTRWRNRREGADEKSSGIDRPFICGFCSFISHFRALLDNEYSACLTPV